MDQIERNLDRLKNWIRGRSPFSKSKNLQWQDAFLKLMDSILMLRDEIQELNDRVSKNEGRKDYASRIRTLEEKVAKLEKK